MFMKSALFSSLVAVSALALVGCGGGPRQILPSGVVFQQTRTIGPAGGSIASARDNIRVVAGPNALLAATNISVEIYADQFGMIGSPGWVVHHQGVKLFVDPEAVRGGRSIVIEMPFPGPHDPEGTMLAVQNRNREVYALESRLSPDGTYISANLDSRRLRELQTTPPGTGAQEELIVFTATRTATRGIPPLQTAVYGFSNGQFQGVPPDLTGLKVAIVVHGIDSSLADLQSLGQFLAGYRLPGETTPYYDAVIGFQYSSNNPLANIGNSCARMLAPLIRDAASADLFAHSMGNLVSRYAMETPSLGAHRLGQWIHHYVSLGGPHAGVPFANIPFMQTLTWLFGGESYYCIKDLATDGKDGAPLTNFLTNLNTTSQGPDFNTASYFTLAGSDYRDLYKGIIPEGEIINGLYTLSVGSGTVNDGLVAEYSAQSDVLAQQSWIWQPGPTLPIDHTELHTSASAFQQIGNWIRAWGQE
jgi:hypothetical protein